jgi:hypothetical protein
MDLADLPDDEGNYNEHRQSEQGSGSLTGTAASLLRRALGRERDMRGTAHHAPRFVKGERE